MMSDAMNDEPIRDAMRTIARPVRVEIEKIRGSRFICDLAPVGDDASALAFVGEIRSIEPGATHHCWAYRLSSGSARSSDDREPGGTAGPPILHRLESAGLLDVVAVVTRYYGGTNLGTGGLIRAYGSAAASAIEAARIITRRRMVTFWLSHPYELSGAVERVLAASDADVVASRYERSVTLEVRVPASGAEAFPSTIREATAGTVVARLIEP